MKCENLDVWKIAIDLSFEVYLILDKCKNYGFKDQITRSALSISSNLAEGMEKSSIKEQIRFIEISEGFCSEFVTQSMIGMKASLIPDRNSEEWILTGRKMLGMLDNLQKYLRSKLNQ